jgi:hypothetical protein
MEKEITIEEFNKFAAWWISKREYAEKIAEEICGHSPDAIFITNWGDGKNQIGFTHYPWDDAHYTETEYFPSEWLFDPNAIEKARAIREENKRQEKARQEEQEKERRQKDEDRIRAEYKRLMEKYENK